VVTSLNQKNSVTVTLRDSLATATVIATAAVTSSTNVGDDSLIEEFEFANIAPGNYELVVTKMGHLSITVRGIIVSDGNLDLRNDNRTDVQLLSMIAGNVNGDEMVNLLDLLAVLADFGRIGDSIVNPATDLDGDGMVNLLDLLIVLRNFGQVEVTIS
jgi:hypothetical protein